MPVRYYAVTCKHGHHGAKKFEPITFAISATNALDACDMARQMPGVKHNQPVLVCREITPNAYFNMRKRSAYDSMK